MSFFRHKKIYQSDEPKGGRAYRSASLATIVPMSLQPAIPSWVALQQSPCPLRRLFTASLSDLLLYSFRQRTVTCPYFPCLNTGVHSKEVDRVRLLYNRLAGRSYTAADGTMRRLAVEDFLFLAPYNAQVRALKAALPPNARIGSVDRFQGQQAPVCILSLCSSYGEYGARGLSFILDRNRINVAISRAQCMAIVVADPRIAQAEAGSLTEMTLTNLFCKLLEQGTLVEVGASDTLRI